MKSVDSTEPGSPPTQYEPPDDWQPGYDELRRNRLFVPLAGLAAMLLGIACLNLLVTFHADTGLMLKTAMIGLPIGACILLFVTLYRIQRQLMSPLSQVRHWAKQMCSGRITARIPEPDNDAFTGLARDINSLGEAMEALSMDLDTEVKKQTERIAQKTHSLEVLYDVAATINVSRDLDDLLGRFLRIMKDVVNARAACVRLLDERGTLRIVASAGLDSAKLEAEHLTVASLNMGINDINRAGKAFDLDLSRACSSQTALPYFDDPNVEMIAVPLQYRGNTLGVYHMFIDKPGLYDREDVKELLTSIGRHLGMAIEKSHMDSEARQFSIMQERATLANELHDSLAQTLASLRFQVRVLDETLQQSGGYTGIAELERVENSLDEAYSELRELIAHFRAPMDGRGLLPSIDAVVKRFRNQTDIAIFLQCSEWKVDSLPPNMEMHVLRIVQESLANIRKHSHANNVRVMLRSDRSGNCQVLVEDDGIGVGSPVMGSQPGEHIGLSIMRERASSVGGELRIESEPGEGTSIELTFQYHKLDPAILPAIKAS